MPLVAWAAAHRVPLESALLQHGGILFRGFPVSGAADLHALIAAVASPPQAYREQSSPRTELSDHIYTSTEYPADQTIAFHCENSYQHVWPLRIFFHCVRAADTGGETPLADVRRVYQRLPAAIREPFAARQVMYVRNFADGLGLPWQRVFQSADPATVDAFCREHDLRAEWRGADKLRTRAVRPAVRRHPQTGEWVWFNHAAFFHVSTLPPEVGRTLRLLYPDEELPATTFYGDGGPIPDAVIADITQAYEAESVRIPRRRGDVLMLDNMLVAHGRRPNTGDRQGTRRHGRADGLRVESAALAADRGPHRRRNGRGS